MATIKVLSVPLVAQPTDGVCWWASCQMLYQWSQATGQGSMIDPNSDDGFRNRYESNLDWGCGKNGFMADTLKMKKFTSVTMDLSSLVSFLNTHGPVFTSVQKNWGGNNHGHAVVMCGVADTGVLIHDPEPMKSGSKTWLTWDQINKAIDAIKGEADFSFLTAA